MKRRFLLFAAAALAAPAAAQHHDHAPAGPAKPTDPHAGHDASKGGSDPGHKPAEPKPSDPHADHKPAEPKPADPHAGHQPAEPKPADPHAGHTPEPAADPHAGHMPEPADPHSGHARPEPPAAPPPPAAASGPAHAADLLYPSADMAAARTAMHQEHGGMTTSKALVDRLEAKLGRGGDLYAWDAEAWHGGDIDKFWLKTEGEGEFGGRLEQVELQALWSRAIDPWFDLQLGLRQDFRPGPNRTHLALGVQGLAPYWFEIDAAAFLSAEGEITARFEGEYDLRLTQRLILQPRLELDLAFEDMPELGIGSGLSAAAAGARLRYELRPEFAPYLGLEYERAFGDTADFVRAAGDKAGRWNLLIGLRTWF